MSVLLRFWKMWVSVHCLAWWNAQSIGLSVSLLFFALVWLFIPLKTRQTNQSNKVPHRGPDPLSLTFTPPQCGCCYAAKKFWQLLDILFSRTETEKINLHRERGVSEQLCWHCELLESLLESEGSAAATQSSPKTSLVSQFTWNWMFCLLFTHSQV